jgi:hypothetical protein
VSGEHPLYNGKNGTPFLKLVPEDDPNYFKIDCGNLGRVYRTGHEFDQSVLIKGEIFEVGLSV